MTCALTVVGLTDHQGLPSRLCMRDGMPRIEPRTLNRTHTRALNQPDTSQAGQHRAHACTTAPNSGSACSGAGGEEAERGPDIALNTCARLKEHAMGHARNDSSPAVAKPWPSPSTRPAQSAHHAPPGQWPRPLFQGGNRWSRVAAPTHLKRVHPQRLLHAALGAFAPGRFHRHAPARCKVTQMPAAQWACMVHERGCRNFETHTMSPAGNAEQLEPAAACCSLAPHAAAWPPLKPCLCAWH